jgi:uncharacterized linocin/CFP29 family protein
VNHLLRSHAPVSDLGWKLLDEEAAQRVQPALAARRLVDFSGPLGWAHSATNLGRARALAEASAEGVSANQRLVLPLVELRASFRLEQAELFDADRGADDVDLGPLDVAAHRIARAENMAVFDGWEDAIVGISQASTHEKSSLGELEAYPMRVAAAVEQLLCSGVGGPYGMALGGREYRLVLGSSEPGGYPVLEHLKRILEGPVVWAPGVDGGVVVSLRGGDFLFESGQDLSIGYESHDAQTIALYLEESFSFHVATPEAAVALLP